MYGQNTMLPKWGKQMTANQNELIQMQEETNRIIESIESQRLDTNATGTFIYCLFIIVAVSMIFEYFVRAFKEDIRNKKQEGKSPNDIRVKLLITYGIHIASIIILWIVSLNLLNFTSIYTWFLVIITVYIVEIAPLFTIHLKKKEENK